MGNSCCGRTEDLELRGHQNNRALTPLTLYGDPYDASTRALQVICIMANVHNEYRPISCFKNEHMTSEFTELNAKRTVPFLTRGPTKEA